MLNSDCIIHGLILTCNCACIVYLFRTKKVYKERKKVLDIIREQGLYDIANGKDYKWRLDEFDSISYFDMLLPFWKHVGSFYKDKKCLKNSLRMSYDNISKMD